MQSNILVGSDPEVFVETSTGSIIPSIGLIGGDKRHPRDIGIGSIQEDNVLAEFNTHPASNRDEFINNVSSVIEALTKELYPNHINIKASHTFDINDLMKYGPSAFIFGCDPDFNAHTKGINPRINVSDVGGLRSAGGHIHVGLTLANEEEAYKLAAMMDVYLGIPSVILDDDKERRRLYGKAGAFRFKPYGIEYRTLSNFWIRSKELIGWAYDNTILAANDFQQLDSIVEKSGYTLNDIQMIINFADTKAATEVINNLNIPMPTTK